MIQVWYNFTGIPGCNGGESVTANKVTSGWAIPGGSTQNGAGLWAGGGHVGEWDLTPASTNVQVCEWFETSLGLCFHFSPKGHSCWPLLLDTQPCFVHMLSLSCSFLVVVMAVVVGFCSLFEDFLGMFNHSTTFFFLKWRSARGHQFHSVGHNQSTRA